MIALPHIKETKMDLKLSSNNTISEISLFTSLYILLPRLILTSAIFIASRSLTPEPVITMTFSSIKPVISVYLTKALLLPKTLNLLVSYLK